MCKTPDPPEIKVPEPQVLRNPFLDSARSDTRLVDSLRTGRSALRVPLDAGLGIGFTSRTMGSRQAALGSPSGNARRPASGGASTGLGLRPTPPTGLTPRQQEAEQIARAIMSSGVAIGPR